MTREEVKQFMRRIKHHYQEFTVDEFRINEWNKALAKYDFDDVNNKLDEHLTNEEYGNQIPKVYFLTKFLRTIEQKEKAKSMVSSTRCFLCGEEMMTDKFDKHYERCSSVNYFIKKYKEIYDKVLERDKLMSMSDEAFNNNYEKLLKVILRTSDDENEIMRINFVFEPPEKPVDITKLVSNKEEEI